MGMRLRSQREPSKRCVCVCVGGGEYSTSHSRQLIVFVPTWLLILNSQIMCPMHIYTHRGRMSRFKTRWLLGL